MTQPYLVAGPLADGDLCDLTWLTRKGRRYCHQPAVIEGVQIDGTVRLLCAECKDRLFPAHQHAA